MLKVPACPPSKRILKQAPEHYLPRKAASQQKCSRLRPLMQDEDYEKPTGLLRIHHGKDSERREPFTFVLVSHILSNELPIQQ